MVAIVNPRLVGAPVGEVFTFDHNAIPRQAWALGARLFAGNPNRVAILFTNNGASGIHVSPFGPTTDSGLLIIPPYGVPLLISDNTMPGMAQYPWWVTETVASGPLAALETILVP